MDSAIYERQIRLFGYEGQLKLVKSSVAIVGIGGLGSHIVQQLAHLGVGQLTLIDDDLLDDTNFNRLIGLNCNDAIGTPKVDILKRLIKNINPSIKVEVIQDSAISKSGLECIKKSSFVFSSVDNDGVRSYLNELVQAFEIPCIDVATEIHLDPVEYGGRVIFIDEKGCLVCYSELDQNEVSGYFQGPNARKDLNDIYGVDKSHLNDSGPSVVTLNGVLASLATIEFVVYVTGLRDPFKYLTYRGSSGIVTKSVDNTIADCYYCNSVRGSGKISNY